MSQEYALGTIEHENSTRSTDYLYRISIKSLIRNNEGRVLVVKESGRDYWDLPGGGMDHHESIELAIARELKEEVGLVGDFTYKIIAVDEAAYAKVHDFWQVRLIFAVTPEAMEFTVGEDADEIAFVDPGEFKDSDEAVERKIYHYASIG